MNLNFFDASMYFRYGLSWNPNLNGHLLSASDDHVSLHLLHPTGIVVVTVTKEVLFILDITFAERI